MLRLIHAFCLVASALSLGAALKARVVDDAAATREGCDHPKDTIVIVRTHRPTPGMLPRFLEYYQDLADNMPAAELLISFDTSRMSATEAHDYLHSMKMRIPGAKFHVYDWRQAAHDFPVLQNLSFASGWNMHVESLLDAVRYMRHHACVSDDAHFWTLEDDVFFCGKISAMLKSYAEDSSDLLFAQKLDMQRWPWRKKASDAFRRMYRSNRRSATSEVMQRFSRSLLNHLEELSRNGVSAWSEMFASTVCENDGFACQRFRDEHVGRTGWDLHISKEESIELCKNATKTTVYHAAKF